MARSSDSVKSLFEGPLDGAVVFAGGAGCLAVSDFFFFFETVAGGLSGRPGIGARASAAASLRLPASSRGRDSSERPRSLAARADAALSRLIDSATRPSWRKATTVASPTAMTAPPLKSQGDLTCKNLPTAFILSNTLRLSPYPPY